MSNQRSGLVHRVFLEHPHSIGERYREHARVAAGAGLLMIGGGLACLVHAAVPSLFQGTASGILKRLHARMIFARSAEPAVESLVTLPATSGSQSPDA